MENQIIEDIEVLEALKDTGSDSENQCIQKEKKPRSEKQIIAFQKVLDTRNKNRADRKLLKEQEMEKEKQETESKILKKAISIKKKQIKKELVLDDISDDETPFEELKKKIIKSQMKQKAVLPVKPVMPRPPLIYM
jgi:signal recognition particle GTPase